MAGRIQIDTTASATAMIRVVQGKVIDRRTSAQTPRCPTSRRKSTRDIPSPYGPRGFSLQRRPGHREPECTSASMTHSSPAWAVALTCSAVHAGTNAWAIATMACNVVARRRTSLHTITMYASALFPALQPRRTACVQPDLGGATDVGRLLPWSER